MALTKNTKLAAAGLIAVVVLVAVWALLGKGDVETHVILEDRNGQCWVRTKEDRVTIKKDKKLTWVIDNQCTNRSELVTVGNFRTGEISIAPDCLQPTLGEGVLWPFKENIEDRSKRQGTQKIELHIKKHSDLPGGPFTYYYDICTGANAERKSDPRLVIEH